MEKDPEHEPQGHAWYTPLPGGAEQRRTPRRGPVPVLAVAGVLGLAIAGGSALYKPAPAPAPTTPAAETAGEPARSESCPGHLHTKTGNAFQPYARVAACPPGKTPKRIDWPQPGDCACYAPGEGPTLGR